MSEDDRRVIEEEGVILPRARGKRRRKMRGDEKEERKTEQGGEKEEKTTEGGSVLETEWRDVRKYMNPNPHLKVIEPGRYAPKVSSFVVCLFQCMCGIHV